ncbi:MAG: TIGR03960 family B12-binding radical SAM protein [Thermoanaerobacteraceae bacterium]|nr:TIGR03960 family B12-binding radical SAM protein [Thermoanaerobacteraceae bacterium]
MLRDKILNDILPRVEKPARYIGNELNSVHKDFNEGMVRFAFAFPDIYEIGMSHLGIKILYHLLNEREDIICERVFAPWVDLEKIMKEEGIPLFSLESMTPVKDFDFVGFTLQYEMSYTNILNMLFLAGIPLDAAERSDRDPLVIAGGPCAYNPEPLAQFIDFFVMGEGEEVIGEIVDVYKKCKESGMSRKEILRNMANIEGVYVPSLYVMTYNEDGTVRSVEPVSRELPSKIKKRVIRDLDETYYPDKMIVPYLQTVHDRIMLEIFRGCTRGCRFCQAGMIYRPIRERSVENLMELAKKLVASTGYDEISLVSLSSCDYTFLNELIESLIDEFKEKGVGISLPSLRIDASYVDIFNKIEEVRKSGITFAPEAGSQRLRDVINKNVTEDDLVNAVSAAFKFGWRTVKLYFMIGLPTETDADLIGIAELGERVLQEYKRLHGNIRGLTVTLSASSFVPKPHTPFQWEAQDSMDELHRKQSVIRSKIKGQALRFTYHDARLSFLEAVISRGDRRISMVLKRAWEKGCRFDSWNEYFNFDIWMDAFKETGVDPDFYAGRKRSDDEVFPWDHIDTGVDKEFLRRERDRAYKGRTTFDCRKFCIKCGIEDFEEGLKCYGQD